MESYVYLIKIVYVSIISVYSLHPFILCVDF